MNRTHVLVAIVALLSISALAIAAATVDVPRRGDPGYGTGTGSGVGDDTGIPDREATSGGPSLQIPPILALIGTFLMGAAFVALVLYILWSVELTDLVKLAVVGVAVVLFSIMLFAFLSPDLLAAGDRPTPPNGTDNGTGGGSGDFGQMEREDVEQTNYDLPMAFVALTGLFALLLSLTIVRFSGSEAAPDVTPVARESEAGSDGVVEAVGEAAGRAADDLEDDADVENTVYRAWEEMTTALDVSRTATTTPAEFADAAREAGMAREDVRDLTEVFEEVRYGDHPVTEERERRAQAALRNIEDAYARDDDE